MQYKHCFFLLQFLIFYNQNHVSFANPLSPVQNIRDTNVNEFPFLASIGYKNYHGSKVNHFCTGALISKKFILTAEHCFKDEDENVSETPGDIQVKVNAVSLKQASKYYNVTGWILYDEWAAKNNKIINHNDMAIMLLTEEVEGVQSAQLSGVEISSLKNKPAIVIGYGETDGTGPSDILHAANVTLLPQNECIKKYREMTHTRAVPSKDHFCTHGSPYVVLQGGDSGGPILDSNKQIIGVSSYTCPGPQCDTVNLHLAVEDHMDFIEDVTKNPQKYF